MNLEIFKNSGFELRGVLINNEPFFVLADICKALDLSNPTMVSKNIKKDDLNTIEVIDSIGRNQKAIAINENGLYKVIFQSRKEEALQFQEWVTSEVLPSIRKNGMYATAPTLENMINNPDFAISLLTKLKEEQKLRMIEKESREREEEKNKKLLLQIEIEKPLTDFGRAISNTDANINVGSFAKLIENKLNIKFGRNKCFNWLREKGYLTLKNEPKQQFINQGIFNVGEHLRTNGSYQKIDITTLITGKGQEYLFNKISKDLLVEVSH